MVVERGNNPGGRAEAGVLQCLSPRMGFGAVFREVCGVFCCWFFSVSVTCFAEESLVGLVLKASPALFACCFQPEVSFDSTTCLKRG